MHVIGILAFSINKVAYFSQIQSWISKCKCTFYAYNFSLSFVAILKKK